MGFQEGLRVARVAGINRVEEPTATSVTRLVQLVRAPRATLVLPVRVAITRLLPTRPTTATRQVRAQDRFTSEAPPTNAHQDSPGHPLPLPIAPRTLSSPEPTT